MAELKGLTKPRNAALELQELMRQEQATDASSSEPEGQTPAPSEVEAVPSVIASSQPSNVATSLPSEVSSYVASKQTKQRGSKHPSYRPSVTSPIELLKKTPLSQLNIRVPQGFNDWLDDEAHRHRKEGVTKQSLVTRALEMLIAHVESTEER